jgi:cytoskeleton protein RodZ
MKITGQILKENRERKGISISEVAIATKINNKMLAAMEEGNLDQLPPKTFLRGFVRAYAAYLDLDVESVMSTFYDEMGSTKPKVMEPAEPATPRQRPAPNEADEAINPKTSLAVKISAVAGILTLVILIVFFKDKMESYEREALDRSVPEGIQALAGISAESENPPSAADGDGAPSDDDDGSSASTEGQSAPVSSATPANPPTPTPEPTPAPTPTPASTATPTAAPTATPNPSPTPGPSPTPAAAVETAASPTPRPGRATEIIIEALDAVDVDVQVDDEGSRKIRLRAEQVQSIQARRRVVLRFSDGGAVNLIVNGVERGVPGDLGKPLRIELP